MFYVVWIGSLILVLGAVFCITGIMKYYRYSWSFWKKFWAVVGIVISSLIILGYIALPKILRQLALM